MSETLTESNQSAEVPFSFLFRTTELIGHIRALSFRTQQTLLNESYRSLKEEIAVARIELFSDVKEHQDEFSNDQKIFLNSLFRNLSVTEGIDFKGPNRELAHFRRLTPGTNVRLLELDNRYQSPETPSQGKLANYPNVNLEFVDSDEEGLNYTTRAVVEYEFAGHTAPITKTWLEYNVQILS